MGLKIKTHKKSPDQKLTPKKSHAEFLSLKKSPEQEQEHYQESSDCCCSYLNKATQKNTWQVLLPQKKSRIECFFFFFWGGEGAFWSENGSRLCLSGMVFEGTTGVYERFYHFCFKCLNRF